MTLKERGQWGLIARLRLPALTPFGAMFDDPIRQSPLKTYIATRLLGLDPFVLQDLFTLRLKFPIK